jgi:hypothetical protein
VGVPATHGEQSDVYDSQQVIAPAFYPEKESWKSQPGHRYTAEELAQMQENWDVALFNPTRPTCRSVD